MEWMRAVGVLQGFWGGVEGAKGLKALLLLPATGGHGGDVLQVWWDDTALLDPVSTESTQASAPSPSGTSRHRYADCTRVTSGQDPRYFTGQGADSLAGWLRTNSVWLSGEQTGWLAGQCILWLAGDHTLWLACQGEDALSGWSRSTLSGWLFKEHTVWLAGEHILWLAGWGADSLAGWLGRT